MRILIIGSGGREYAIALKLFEENNNFKLYISPGNAGTKNIGENVNLNFSNHQAIVSSVSYTHLTLPTKRIV